MDMNKELGLYYPVSNAYDKCLVSSFLKTLFAKCREKKTTPDLTITGNIAEIKNEIEALNKDNSLELSFDYLSAMETSLPDAGLRYVIINKDKTPVLFVYFQVFTLSTQNFNLEKNKGFVKGILSFFLKLKKAKVLILGNALRTETLSYCFDARILNKEEAIAAIAGVAEKIAGDENATAVILKDIPGATASAEKMLTSMGYSMPWEDQVMEMAVDPEWKNLQDYTALLTRKYKTRANKVLTSAKPLVLKVLTENQVSHYLPEIKQLFAKVVDKQSFTLTSRGANNISLLKQLYKDEFDVAGFFHEDKLVAFYSAFVTGDSYELYYIGFDYQMNNEYQLYFNLLFSGLERAILLKKKYLKLGRTSFDAKASVGAQPKKLDYMIKMIHIPDIVVKWFASYFSSLEDTKWKLRNPLKGNEQLS